MAILKLNLSGHKNDALAELGFIFPGALHVDLQDEDLKDKIVEFLKAQGVDSSAIVHAALPGLAPLATMVVAAIHGLTGSFPVVYPLIRGDEGFVPAEPFDLTEYRNAIARQSREGAINL